MPPTGATILQLLGVVFVAEGLLGVIVPDSFRAVVIWLQTPPVWPTSVAARALVGLALLSVAMPVRSALAVRVVGIATLVGAAAGMLFTNADQLPSSPVWRLPALVLLVAGCVVVWGAGSPRAAA